MASLQARHPVADSFLTGVLAVAVASPCTAPFMGASLGLTATLPAPQALAVFAALGLGLALPYLAASFVPAVARALPRPGAWMDTFRKLMAFPMLATEDGRKCPNSNTPARLSAISVNSAASPATTAGDCS